MSARAAWAGVAIAIAFSCAPVAQGADLIGGTFGATPGGPIQSGASYSGIFLPQMYGATTLQTDVTENRGRGTLSLYDNGVDSWGLIARGGAFYFGSPPLLQESSSLVPIESCFYDVEGGAAYRHVYARHQEVLLTATGGSASDQPFYSMAETVFQANAFYLLPLDERHSWTFVVNWSNNRQFLNYIPIPGAVYSLTSEDRKFHLSVGFPFDRISYELAPGLLAKAQFVGISQASAELSLAVSARWQFYAGYDWGQRSWLRVARVDPLNRLFYDEQRAMLGVRSDLTRAFSADASGGYAFIRQAFEAHSYFSPTTTVATFPAEWEFQLALSLRAPANGGNNPLPHGG